ncbi:MAG: hypothetical protein WC750_02960 [Patescibacteria group bacterium]|jgi:hypothetical protein
MLKSKSIIPHDRPVYREVIPQALKTAWRNPVLWIFGIFAAVLNTGGSLDACWKFFNTIQNQGNELFIGDTAVKIWNVGTYGGFHFLPFFQAILALLALSLILLAVAGFACVSQGVLVQSIGGAWKADTRGKLKAALTVSGRALVPIAILNALIIVSVWLARFLVSLPLAIALGKNSTLFTAIYLVSFVVFFALAIVLSVIQIYALNAMILQGASLSEAFHRAWLVLKEHWLVTLETAILQACVILILTILALVALLILCFLPAIFYVMAIFRNNFTLFQISTGMFVGIAALAIIFFTGFTVTFQYALWTLMFRKLGEGGVVPKLHRFIRFVTRQTHVPQS